MNKKLIIRGSLLAAIIGVVGAAVPFAFIKNNESSETPKYTNASSPMQFEENLKEITKDTIQNEEIDFYGDEPWLDLPSDINNPLYDEVFAKIDDQLIINDIKYWLIDIGDVSDAFSIKINSITVENLNRSINSYSINIDFDIYNNTATRKLFKTETLPFSYGINGYKISRNVVNITNAAEPKFQSFTDYSMVGYKFDDAQWSIDDKSYNVKNFSFGQYSKTLNTKISNVDMGIGYLDIKEEGNAYLDNLTSEIITNQILTEQKSLIDTISVNIAPVQKILQSYATNPKLKDFVSTNANNIVEIILNLVPADALGFDLATAQNLLLGVLQNKKITTLLVENKNVLIDLLKMLNFDLGGFNTFIENATVEDYENLLRSLANPDGILGPIVDESFLGIINELLEKGIIDFLIENGVDLIAFVNKLIPGIDSTTSMLADLLHVMQKGGVDQPIINLTIDLINAKDESGSNILSNLLKTILPVDLFASMGDLIDQVLFSNGNLTVGNLQSALNALANPVDAKKGSKVKSYAEFFEKMTITQEVTRSNYNQTTHEADIEVMFRFKFNDTLWINLNDVYKILPANLSIDGTSIPIGLIGGVAPNWVGLFSGDYVSDDRILTEKLHYDVVKNSEGLDVLSWQTSQKSVFDVHLPQTVKSLWDTSTTGTGNLILHFAQNFMYHKYYTNDLYKPSLIHKSEVIENYNPNKKNGQSIEFNTLTSEQMTALTELVKNSMRTVETGDVHSWKYLWTNYSIKKSITNNIVDINYVISQLVKNNNITNEDIPLYIDFNSDYLIRETKFIGLFTIPEVRQNNIILWTPANVYNNKTMNSKWTFTL